MLQNAYFLANIGADTAENEQHSAKILPKIGNYPTLLASAGRLDADDRADGVWDVHLEFDPVGAAQFLRVNYARNCPQCYRPKVCW